VIRIKINDTQLKAKLNGLVGRLQNPRAMLADIGEYMIMATKRRFTTGTAPDGTAWASNTPATLLAFGRRRRGSTSKRQGEKIKQGAGLLIGKRPLIGESKRLGREIVADVSGTRVVVSSSLEQSRVMQYGARKGEFGKTKRGASIPWGDIPARPYMGFSPEDEKQVLEIVREHLDEATR
jgi:phage virion morphogenesis protein